MEICTNKKTGQAFIHLDVDNNNQALMITPQGVVKALQYDLFTEPVEVEDEDALEKGGINSSQYATYNQYRQNSEWQKVRTKRFIYNPYKLWVKKKLEPISQVPLHLVPELDEGLEVGSRIQVKDNHGNDIKATVTHIFDQAVRLDENPPLAGEALPFGIELIEFLWCFVHLHDRRVAYRSSNL